MMTQRTFFHLYTYKVLGAKRSARRILHCQRAEGARKHAASFALLRKPPHAGAERQGARGRLTLLGAGLHHGAGAGTNNSYKDLSYDSQLDPTARLLTCVSAALPQTHTPLHHADALGALSKLVASISHHLFASRC